MTHTLELGGRTFAVTRNTAGEFAALRPQFAALCGTAFPEGQRLRDAIESLPGARLVILHKLRQADPTVTAEWVAEWVPDTIAAHNVYADLMRCELTQNSPGGP